MFVTMNNIVGSGDLGEVQRLIASAKYVDGRVTAKVENAIKNNLEMEVNEPYLKLTQILDRALDSSGQLTDRIFPRSRTTPIINRFDTGMYYREHMDFPVQGAVTQFGRAPGRYGQNFIRTDYSMTLFLTSPESYDGGELQLQVGERQELVKLPAGSAVCYQTGIPHAVRPVTRGSRICAIYWFQSCIRDMNIRRTLWDLRCLQHKLERSREPQLSAEAGMIRDNFLRYLADI